MGNWRWERIPDTDVDETLVGRHWERCVADCAIKVVGGIMIGGCVAVSLKKIRSWPVIAGGATGLGKACWNCNHELAPKSKRVLTE